MESTLCQLIKELRQTLQVTIDVYDYYKLTGKLPGTMSDDAAGENSSSSPPRVENIRAPFPPYYPPPHAQNSPAFFPLSRIQAPKIEPEDLEFTLEEVLVDQGAAEVPDPGTPEESVCASATGIRPVDQRVTIETPEPDPNKDNTDQSYDPDSSDGFSWAQWYVTRDYATEREEQDRQDAAQRAAASQLSNDESLSDMDDDSAYGSGDSDDNSNDDLEWKYYGVVPIAPY